MLTLHIILRDNYREQESIVLETYGRQIQNNIDNRMDYFISYLKMLSVNHNLVHAMETEDFQTVNDTLKQETSEFLLMNAGRVNCIRPYRSGIYSNTDSQENINEILTALKPTSTAYPENILITGTYLNSRNEKVFSIFQRVYQTNSQREYCIEMCIYETELLSFFNKDISGNQISILHGNKIMSMNDRQLFSKYLYDSKGKDLLETNWPGIDSTGQEVTITTEDDNQFNVLIKTSTDYLDQGYRLTLIRMMPVLMVVLIMAFFFTWIFTVHLHGRLKMLQEKIAAISNWNLTEKLHIDGNDEFGILADELDDTRIRILDLIDQNKKINQLIRVAEMSALRAQINSHFLFNSLSSIKWLSRHDNPKSLAEAVDSLALILRYSLALDENQVTLTSELQHLEAYIYLLKLRYQNDVTVQMDIDDELLQCKTVKLILQPLVENAIYHGRREDGSHLNITIYSSSEEDYYLLTVEDDGNGISSKQLQDIRNGKVENSRNGYGLKNVIERVRMCSEGKGKVEIESRINVYTKVTIRQPR
jgi:two-component system sensor histidine kinase YesM